MDSKLTLYVVGAAYLIAYFAICWKRPQVAMMLIFALAPFQSDIGAMGRQQDTDAPIDPTMPDAGGGGVGPHYSIAEINLMLAAVLFLLKRRPFRFGPALLPSLAYFGICTASSLVTWRPSTMTSMVQMILYIIVAVMVYTSLGRRAEDFYLSFYGLMAVGMVLAVAVLVTHSGYVLNLHKNGVGASLSGVVVVSTEMWLGAATKRRRMILGIITAVLSAGLFFTLSRGGWVGAGVGVVILLVLRREFKTMIRVLVAAVPLLCICWVLLPDKSKDYTTGLSAKNENIQMRYNSVQYALYEFNSSPLLGVGVGLRKEYDATNLLLMILAETGIGGVITFLWIQFAVLKMAFWTQKRLSRSDPLYSPVAIGGALMAGRLVHGMVDHYWSRGAISMAWAGAGMATYGYLIVRQRSDQARKARRAALRQALVDEAAEIQPA